jgi:hypothetical protein
MGGFSENKKKFLLMKQPRNNKIALSKQLVRFLNWNIASGSCTCLEEHFLNRTLLGSNLQRE